MDRNREARRAAATNNHNHHHTNNNVVPLNGLSSSSSRRRYRSNSLRDSSDEDGGVELHEQGRLRERERGAVKKDRERERVSRRENRAMMMTSHTNRDTEIDDTSEESVNDEEDEDDGNGSQRMLPPPSANSVASGTVVSSNHHNTSHPQYQLHHRRSFPPTANKVFRAVAPAPPALKAADEMIGVSVPRKARSASTKRSHEWISGGGVVGGGAGTDQNHRQSSASPVHLASAAESPAPVAPLSPSSSQVSVRKKMKVNGVGAKPRPPKSSSKSSSSNPEELEIEIAEVLYGLMTQSQAPSKKEITTSNDNKSTSDNNKSRVSSPISNSIIPPQNSTSLATVAPKRKKPRHVSENPVGVRNNPVKNEVDHINKHQYHQSPKADSSGSAAVVNFAAENGGPYGFTSLPGQQPSSVPPHAVADNEGKCDASVLLTKQEVEKESSAVDNNKYADGVIMTGASVTMTNIYIYSN